jgi:hypothetical protein
MLFSDSVEALKNQYTDKYVRVNTPAPELARFHDAVGQVKTVNMNGRALVQFLDYHLNVGWFDIDPSCLIVVDKPSADVTAKPVPKRAHDTPEGKAAPTAGDKQDADAKATAPAGKKLSPLEMARMQGAAGKGAAAAPAKPASGGAAPAKKSTADILAAARGKAAAPAASAPAAPAAAAPAPAAEPAAAAPPASSDGIVRIDWKSMSTAEKIAYCRAKDAT